MYSNVPAPLDKLCELLFLHAAVVIADVHYSLMVGDPFKRELTLARG